MKVLHFYKTYYPDGYGGVQQVIFQLAERMSALDVESHVLSLSPSGHRANQLLGQHIIHSSRLNFELASTGFSWDVIRHFRELSSKVDLIHYHFPWPFMDLVHLLSQVNKPVLLSYHSDIVKQKYLLHLYKPVMRRFLDKVDAIVAASPAYIEHSQVLKKYRYKTHVIPYGLDESTYPSVLDERLSFWKKKLPERFFLFVGALRYYKGLQFLIEAASLNKLPVVIVGSGGVEADLHDLAYSLKVNVIFTGALSDEDKAALMELSTAFVFPSHLPSEAFGIALLEAAMYGKPLISCEIGTGTTFINIQGDTGLVVPPGDPVALSKAMLSLWFNNDLCQKFGANARNRYTCHFTADVMCRSYFSLYERLLSGV